MSSSLESDRYRRQVVVQRPEEDAELVPSMETSQKEDESGSEGDERATGFQTFFFRPFFPRIRVPFFDDFQFPVFRPSFTYPPFNRRQPFDGVVEVDVGSDGEEDSKPDEDRIFTRPETSRPSRPSRPSLFNFGSIFEDFQREFGSCRFERSNLMRIVICKCVGDL